MLTMAKVHPVIVLLTLSFMSMIVSGKCGYCEAQIYNHSPAISLPFSAALPSKRGFHQVRPVPPIKENNPSPNPGSLSSHHNPTQCLFVCSKDSRCQQMNFIQPPNGDCTCACQVCDGKWYGSINDYTKSTPLTIAQMERCPNFVFGSL